MADHATHFRRSPYLLVTWQGSELMLVQTDRQRRFLVDERLLAVLSALDDWTTADELVAAGHAMSHQMLASLVDTGIVEAAGSGATGPPPPTEPTWWSEFDLAVHRQQNLGPPERDNVDRVSPPPPAFKPPPPGPTTALPPPGELPDRLDDVLARRRSLRAYSERPLSRAALSTLLFHSARVTGVTHDESVGQQAFRPFPGGGARSELELYIVANDIEGLAPGAYYFDAQAHQLVAIRGRDEYQDEINLWVANATGVSNGAPQAIVLITAVFARVMWKYRWVGLGLIYADTGCLYQTLYLTATALGLAPCAVGAGPERDNAGWLGLDPLRESQVGCLLLGVPLLAKEPQAGS